MEISKDPQLLRQLIQKTRLTEILDHDTAESCAAVIFHPGETLIHMGECSPYLYFLVEGKLRAYSYSEQGQVVPFGYFRAFQALGEVSSLWGEPPSLTVEAVERSICLAIDLQSRRASLLRDPAFLQYICRHLCDRVRILNNNMENLMTRPAECRLAAFILQNSNGDVFDCTLSECSELISTSYRHTIRSMNSLCQKGMMRKQNNRYYIENPTELRRIAGQYYKYYG